jgi:hypothetical protein
MFHHWTTVVFGYPAVIGALLTFLAAVRLGRASLAVVAAVVSAPFCLFVSGYPIVGWWGLGVLCCNVLGVIALHRGAGGYSFLFWIPFVVLVGRLTLIV